MKISMVTKCLLIGMLATILPACSSSKDEARPEKAKQEMVQDKGVVDLEGTQKKAKSNESIKRIEEGEKAAAKALGLSGSGNPKPGMGRPMDKSFKE